MSCQQPQVLWTFTRKVLERMIIWVTLFHTLKPTLIPGHSGKRRITLCPFSNLNFLYSFNIVCPAVFNQCALAHWCAVKSLQVCRVSFVSRTIGCCELLLAIQCALSTVKRLCLHFPSKAVLPNHLASWSSFSAELSYPEIWWCDDATIKCLLMAVHLMVLPSCLKHLSIICPLKLNLFVYCLIMLDFK